MKTFLLFLFLAPAQLWAQADTLKLIGTDSIMSYGRYGPAVHSRYTYDGIDIRRTRDLEKYIRASDDVNANAEYDRYLNRRKLGVPLLVVGSITAVSGLIGISIARSASDSSNPFQGPAHSTTGPSGSGGFLVALVGVGLGTWGYCLQTPGQHVRRAVQYYNRALKQRGISWQLTPYSAYSNQGVSLVGKF